MIHCVQDYDPPTFTICCTQQKVEADFDNDPFPLDDIYLTTDGTKFTTDVEYCNCPKCLKAIRKSELALEPDPES